MGQLVATKFPTKCVHFTVPFFKRMHLAKHCLHSHRSSGHRWFSGMRFYCAGYTFLGGVGERTWNYIFPYSQGILGVWQAWLGLWAAHAQPWWRTCRTVETCSPPVPAIRRKAKRVTKHYQTWYMNTKLGKIKWKPDERVWKHVSTCKRQCFRRFIKTLHKMNHV